MPNTAPVNNNDNHKVFDGDYLATHYPDAFEALREAADDAFGRDGTVVIEAALIVARIKPTVGGA